MGSDSSESARVELIVSRFFSKCINVILESRCNYCNNAVVKKDVVGNDTWFNLILKELPTELVRNISGVCASTQLVVDLVLLRRTRCNGNGGLEKFVLSWDGSGGKVIERWVMLFEGKKVRENGGRLRGSFGAKKFYKKCVLLLRSVYSVIKILPGYKLFRDLKASREEGEFSLVHRILSFAEPFTWEEEGRMQKYVFVPVDTSCGRLCVSVLYLSSLVNLKIEPSYQMLPHIVIPDYCIGVSVDSAFKAPMLHSNGMVTYRSKLSSNSREPTALVNNDAPRVTSGEDFKTASSAKRHWPTAQAAVPTKSSCVRSHSLDPPSHTAKTSPYARSGSLGCSRFDVGHCQNPIELGDPFQPRLSDNAALGSMFSIFHEAAPLCQSSSLTPNNTNLQATSVPIPANPTVKTTLDALRELQDHIELKNRILQRKPNKTPNIDSQSAATKSPIQ